MLATVGAAVLVLCGLLWLVRRMVVGPLRVLRDRAEQVGAGRTPIPQVPLRSRDEIGALARSFEEMARRVASNEQELRERVEARTRELVRAARYADIGVLAAGVAHEINNPLASIASCAEGLERRLRKREVALAEQCEDLQTIASEAYRARSITARLLALARPERSPDARVELDRVAREVEAMTRYQFEERAVRLTLDLPSTGTAVVGDHGDLLQMTVNLVLNARDASPRGAEVQLRVRAAAGAEVELIVDDAGDGVPAADVDRIFDPFFTTKEVGQGTGLGLALVAAVVEAHRGRIRVGRSPAGGARFEVALRGWSGVPG
jgi:signal transduction histidine kinase